MQKEYKTVYRQACEEIIEKKSRFIASVKPVKNEDEAIGFINAVRARYRDASHNVYAYYIAGENMAQRYSDDGEPSGTGGMPVLEAIKKPGLQDVVVVVTRYFGGTLLGAAGLVRAYGRSASEGIKAAVIVNRALCKTLALTMDYIMIGRVQSIILVGGHIIENSVYGQDVKMEVCVRVDDVDAFISAINEATGARVAVRQLEALYVTIDQEGKRL